MLAQLRAKDTPCTPEARLSPRAAWTSAAEAKAGRCCAAALRKGEGRRERLLAELTAERDAELNGGGVGRTSTAVALAVPAGPAGFGRCRASEYAFWAPSRF